MSAAVIPWVHPFEVHGLGTAPFSCLGMTVEVCKGPDANGLSSGYPGQPAGSCDFCGMGIKYVYRIQGSGKCDKAFRVGCDCVGRTDDTALVNGIKAARRAYRLEAVRAAGAISRAERDRAAKAQMALCAAGNAVVWAGVIEVLRIIIAAAVATEYELRTAAWVLDEFVRGVRTTEPGERAIETLCSALRATMRPAPKHLAAKVGERVRGIVAVYEGGPRFETSFGMKHLATFRCEDGSVIVWGTTSGVGYEVESPYGGYPQRHNIEKGEQVTLAATVKSHSEHNGCPQTFVLRAKLSA